MPTFLNANETHFKANKYNYRTIVDRFKENKWIIYWISLSKQRIHFLSYDFYFRIYLIVHWLLWSFVQSAFYVWTIRFHLCVFLRNTLDKFIGYPEQKTNTSGISQSPITERQKKNETINKKKIYELMKINKNELFTRISLHLDTNK